MANCDLQPADKKAFISTVGRNLVHKHGKQKHYKPEQVRQAATEGGYAVDVHCWAYCFFCSPGDFQAWHEQMGEACDYAAMKAALVAELAGDTAGSWFAVDLSWLDWPEVDLGSLFDWLDLSL